MTIPLQHLATAIRARASTPGSLDSPAAILWTDHRAEWRGLLPAARSHIPELLVFGDYRPDDRTGPAIWLRCVVDGTIDLPGAAANRPPIIYLPSVERGRLRAGENCPETLRPLVELMFRGVVWHHPNGRDWSVRAFLTLCADGVPAGPGLDVASDPETGKALSRAIGEVFQTRADDLRGRRLDANDFNRLVGVDVDRDTLRWMSDPKSIRDQMDDRRWEAFCAEARRELGFDRRRRPMWRLVQGSPRGRGGGAMCGHGSTRLPSSSGGSRRCWGVAGRVASSFSKAVTDGRI